MYVDHQSIVQSVVVFSLMTESGAGGQTYVGFMIGYLLLRAPGLTSQSILRDLSRGWHVVVEDTLRITGSVMSLTDGQRKYNISAIQRDFLLSSFGDFLLKVCPAKIKVGQKWC